MKRPIRETLETNLEGARVGTWEIDLVTDTVTCSDLMLELWNIKKDEFNGKRGHLQSRVHPEDLFGMQEAIRQAIKSNDVYLCEYRLVLSPQKIINVRSRGRCTYDPSTLLPVRLSGIAYQIP